VVARVVLLADDVVVLLLNVARKLLVPITAADVVVDGRLLVPIAGAGVVVGVVVPAITVEVVAASIPGVVVEVIVGATVVATPNTASCTIFMPLLLPLAS